MEKRVCEGAWCQRSGHTPTHHTSVKRSFGFLCEKKGRIEGKEWDGEGCQSIRQQCLWGAKL
jgi:hypothetical protein